MVQVVTTLDDLVGSFNGTEVGSEKTVHGLTLGEIHAEIRMLDIGTLEGPGEPVKLRRRQVLDQAENAGARGHPGRSPLPVIKALRLRNHCFTDVVQEREQCRLLVGVAARWAYVAASLRLCHRGTLA